MPSCSVLLDSGKKCKNKMVLTNKHGFCSMHQTCYERGWNNNNNSTSLQCRFLKHDFTLCQCVGSTGDTCFHHENCSEQERILTDERILSHVCDCQFCPIEQFRYIPQAIERCENTRGRSRSADSRLPSQVPYMGEFTVMPPQGGFGMPPQGFPGMPSKEEPGFAHLPRRVVPSGPDILPSPNPMMRNSHKIPSMGSQNQVIQNPYGQFGIPIQPYEGLFGGPSNDLESVGLESDEDDDEN